jgi:hypothetical protein
LLKKSPNDPITESKEDVDIKELAFEEMSRFIIEFGEVEFEKQIRFRFY